MANTIIAHSDTDDDDDVTGQDLFADVPTDDDDDDGGPAVMFECSEHAPVPVYRLKVLENERYALYATPHQSPAVSDVHVIVFLCHGILCM